MASSEAQPKRSSGAGCPLCRQRKAKRACPAKGAEICAYCCGTKRRNEIECPADCTYLTGEHAAGWEGRETERRRDLRRIAPHIQGLGEGQGRLFFLTLAGVNALRAGRKDLDDRLLRQAVFAIRKTVETRARGVLYEHPAEDLRAQGLRHELKALFEAKDAEGQATAPDDRDLLAVLGALEASLEDARREAGGPTVFLDSALRLMGRLQGSAAAARAPARPLLIEP